MKLCRFTPAVTLLALILSACAAQLEKDATVKLEADCAAMHLQFVKVSSEKSDNPIFSQAKVSGVCVGPGDPRYVSPATPMPAISP